jgi:Na+/melibiose symporter-like transporter
MEEQSSHRIAGWFRSSHYSLHTLGDVPKRTRDDCSTTGMFVQTTHIASKLIKITQFLERYVCVGSIYMFFFGGAYFVVLYYLPIYFQSIHSASPINSGVRMLALIIPLTLSAILQGFALSKIGIVPLFWIFGGAIATIGAGLFYTMDANTSTGKWIGYQILVGFATGITFQVAIANAQVHAKSEDLSQVSAIVNCKSRPHCTQQDSVV